MITAYFYGGSIKVRRKFLSLHAPRTAMSLRHTHTHTHTNPKLYKETFFSCCQLPISTPISEQNLMSVLHTFSLWTPTSFCIWCSLYVTENTTSRHQDDKLLHSQQDNNHTQHRNTLYFNITRKQRLDTKGRLTVKFIISSFIIFL